MASLVLCALYNYCNNCASYDNHTIYYLCTTYNPSTTTYTIMAIYWHCGFISQKPRLIDFKWTKIFCFHNLITRVHYLFILELLLTERYHYFHSTTYKETILYLTDMAGSLNFICFWAEIYAVLENSFYLGDGLVRVALVGIVIC